MTIWILQIFFDLAVAAAFFQWMLSRKRLQRLEDSLRRLQIAGLSPAQATEASADLLSEITAPQPASVINRAFTYANQTPQPVAATRAPAVNVPRQSVRPSFDHAAHSSSSSMNETFSNLSEQHHPENSVGPARFKSRNGGADAFALAQKLLGQGMSHNQVSERTGLSQAELQLLGKVTHQHRY